METLVVKILTIAMGTMLVGLIGATNDRAHYKTQRLFERLMFGSMYATVALMVILALIAL